MKVRIAFTESERDAMRDALKALCGVLGPGVKVKESNDDKSPYKHIYLLSDRTKNSK